MKLNGILLPVILAATLLASVAAHADKALFSTATGKPVALSAILERAAVARVIIFGERHNDPDDHTGQRTLVQAMHDAGMKVALGLEMFRAESQPYLDLWVEGRLGEEEFARVYARNWSERYYAVYHPLFYYARQEGIPLVGLNIPAELSSKVGRDGFASLSPAERERLGPVTCNVDRKYRELIMKAIGEKKAARERFNNFCEAQVLWDTSMAQSAANYLKDNPGNKVLILAGTYHAWKYGIPEQLEKLGIADVLVILPSDDVEFTNYRLIADEADFIWSSH